MFMMVFLFCCRSTGLPSPLSPIPSPAGSVSSQPGSNDSNGVGHSSTGNSTGSTVTVSCHISSVTSSYVNITSYILHAYEIWEKADALARKNKGKFLPFVFSVSWLCVFASVLTLSAANTIPKVQSMKYVEYLCQGLLAEILDSGILMSVPIKKFSWHPQMSKSLRDEGVECRKPANLLHGNTGSIRGLGVFCLSLWGTGLFWVSLLCLKLSFWPVALCFSFCQISRSFCLENGEAGFSA